MAAGVRRQRFPLWVLAPGLLTGCAIGNVGSLLGHVDRHDGVCAVTIYSLGLDVRGRKEDGGASLGYTRRVYAFVDDGTVPAGWHVFEVPLPAQPALAFDFKTLGAELSTTEPAAGIALGYEHVQVMMRTEAHRSMYIQYQGSSGVPARVGKCKGNQECKKLYGH